MLHDLANDGGFVALKRAAEDREVWRQIKDIKNLLYSRRLLMTWTALAVNDTRRRGHKYRTELQLAVVKVFISNQKLQ